LADSITDPESNPYSPPECDFVGVPDQLEFSNDNGAKKPGYASFGQRFLAFLLDGVILYGFLWLFFFIVLYLIILFVPNDLHFTTMNYYLVLQILTIPTLYFALQESSAYQATFGKRIMGIKVTTLEGGRIPFGHALIRYVCKIPSAIPLFGGFLMQPFTGKKQALHDMLAKTLVFVVGEPKRPA
jgi:uncharacterized RDD family membrane protein YckC